MKKLLTLIIGSILILTLITGCSDKSVKVFAETIYLEEDYLAISFLDNNQIFYSNDKLDLGLTTLYIFEESNESTMSIECNLKDKNSKFNMNYITAEFLGQEVSDSGELPEGFYAWLKLDGKIDLKVVNYKDLKDIIVSFEFEDEEGNLIKDSVKCKVDWSKVKVIKSS